MKNITGSAANSPAVHIGPGVYFLFGSDGELLYVGKSSSSCMKRIFTHKSDGRIPFSSYFVAPLNELDAAPVEAFLIASLRPSMNISGINAGLDSPLIREYFNSLGERMAGFARAFMAGSREIAWFGTSDYPVAPAGAVSFPNKFVGRTNVGCFEGYRNNAPSEVIAFNRELIDGKKCDIGYPIDVAWDEKREFGRISVYQHEPVLDFLIKNKEQAMLNSSFALEYNAFLFPFETECLISATESGAFDRDLWRISDSREVIDIFVESLWEMHRKS